MVLRAAAAFVATFVLSLATVEVADSAPGDPRIRAAGVVALWAAIPVITAFAVSRPAVTWRRWAVAALAAAAGWAAASGVSAAYFDAAISGPKGAVFASIFTFMFLPLVLLVVLTGIVVRLRHLYGRMREAAPPAEA